MEQNLKLILQAVNQASQKLQEVRRELDNLAKGQQQVAAASRQAGDAWGRTLSILGSVGTLYAVQQGLVRLTQAGLEFERQMNRVAAVAQESTAAVERSILFDRSRFRPEEQARALTDLAAAGLDLQSAMNALAPAMNLAIGGMTDLGIATTSVLTVLKTWQLPAGEAGKVADAMAEAGRRTALQMEDLGVALGQSAAAAAQAGQDYTTLLAALGFLRDAGLGASDGATSLRVALLRLASPTDEAKQILRDLGVEITDNQGNFRNLADIITDLQRALSEFTPASQADILARIFGQDAFRAISILTARGGPALRQLKQDLDNATGAAELMARQMGQGAAEAADQLRADLERLGAVLARDVGGGLEAAILGLDRLVVGLQEMDDSVRNTIELLVGGLGLAGALAAVSAGVNALAARLATLGGIGALGGAIAGPWGLAAAALTAIAGTYIYVTGAAEKARREQELQQRQALQLAREYEALQERLSSLQQGTAEYERAAARLAQVKKEIGELAPELVSAWDDEGRAIELNIERVRALRRELEALAQQERATALQQALGHLADVNRKLAEAQAERQRLQQAAAAAAGDIQGPMTALEPQTVGEAVRGPDYARQRVAELDREIRQLEQDARRAAAEVARLSGNPGGSTDAGASLPRSAPRGAQAGRRTFQPPETGGSDRSAPSFISVFRDQIQAITDTLGPYTRATADAQFEVQRLAAQQENARRLMEAGIDPLNALTAATQAQTRAEEALREQQQALHAEAEARRGVIARLLEQQAALDQQYRAGKLAAGDYVEASRALRQEIDRQASAVQQLGLAWWQAQLQLTEIQASRVREIAGLLRSALQMEARDVTRSLQERARRQEQALEERIESLRRESREEIRLQQEIDAVEAEIERRRRQRQEEETRRRIEELRGRVETSRQVVVEHGMRRLTHDLEAERELQEAEAQAAFDAEMRRLEETRDALRRQLEARREARERQREELERELADLRETNQQKLSAVQEYYDALQQDTVLAQEAYRRILQNGYAQELADLQRHLQEMEEARAASARRMAAIEDMGPIARGIAGEGGRSRADDDLSVGSRALLDAKRDWEEAFRRGDTRGMEEAARRGQEIRQRYPTLDPGNTKTADELAREIAERGLESGGEVLWPGWATLHQGETVLTRGLTQRLIPLLERLPAVARPEPIRVIVEPARHMGPDTVEIDSPRNLIIQAQNIYLVSNKPEVRVDTLAQRGYRR